MAPDWIAANWKKLIDPMRENWGKLTHNDLAVAGGERERLIELLEVRYGYQIDQAEAALNEFARRRKADAETQVEDCSPFLTF